VQAPSTFHDLMRRVRAGDGEAATELVRQYEREIRRAIRIKLTDPRLRRTLDSMDICQSVLGNFFVRAAAGQFDLHQPEQLLKLLLTMARNKLLDKARHQQADRRDGRRTEAGSVDFLARIADNGDTPSQIIANQELIETARSLLTEEERYLAEQRAHQRSWADIAADLNANPENLRKQLARAMDRVVGQLGLEGVPQG
jgi:RNA polymerase sigma-70 factor (ECF subfamily)